MKLFGILILAITFTQCKSHKFEQNPPFTVKNAIYTHITGGTPGNNSLDLMIEFTANDGVKFEEVYFQEKLTKAVIEQKGDKQFLAARYNTSTQKEMHDINLVNNSDDAPKSEKKCSFKLNENEAVITYLLNGKSHFYKLKNITKAKSVFMPSAKPQSTQKHL